MIPALQVVRCSCVQAMERSNATDKNCQSRAMFCHFGGVELRERITEVCSPLKRKRFPKDTAHQGN
jgi:hypothetical protein